MSAPRRFSAPALCFLAAAALLGPVLSAPGDLDSGFGGGGTVVEPLNGNSFAWGTVILRDGRIVVVGESDEGTKDFSLVRYDSGGTPDPGFGSGGFVTTDFGRFDAAQGVVVQKDGRVIAGGRAEPFPGQTDFGLARYLENGTPDPDFGTAGRVTADLEGTDQLVDVFLAKKGRIVAAGYSGTGDRDFSIARFLPDGTPDPSFSGDGKVLVDVRLGSDDLANGAALQKNGAVLVGGFRAAQDDLALVRVRSDGVPDPSFGIDGRVIINIEGISEEIESILPLSNGRIMLSGVTFTGGESLAFVMRLLSNGAPDPSFGDEGIVLLDQSEGTVYAGPMIAGSKKRVYVGGSVEEGGKTVFAVWALDKNGDLDPSFGGDGLVTTPIRDFARILGMTADKRSIVAVGFSRLAGEPDFASARYFLK